MNRAQSIAYLASAYPELFGAAGIATPASDTGTGYAVDDALRAYGVAEADLANEDVTSSLTGYLALVRYHGLRRLRSALASKVDIRIGVPELEKKRSQAFKMASDLLAEAEADVAAAGYPTATPGLVFGRVGLDFLEPSVSY